jgi:hypothetical protein
MAQVRRHVTFANVMSVVAVFIALGGSAIAINKIKANSVGSKQIKRGAVKNGDLADNSVTSPKVQNGSLLDEDFASGQLPRGATGPQGATGPTGPTGSIDTSNFYDKAASDARFLGIGATAANASAVGGVPAAVVPRSLRDNAQGPDGATKLGFARRTLNAGEGTTGNGLTLLGLPGVGKLNVGCLAGSAANAFLFFNDQASNIDVWVQDLSQAGNPLIHGVVAPSGFFPSPPFVGSTSTDGLNRAQIIVGSGDTTAGGARAALIDLTMITKPGGANTCLFQAESQSFTN